VREPASGGEDEPFSYRERLVRHVRCAAVAVEMSLVIPDRKGRCRLELGVVCECGNTV